MSGWIGFWIMIGLLELAEVWRWVKKKELQCKYPKAKFKWYE